MAYITWETFERIQTMLRDNYSEYRLLPDTTGSAHGSGDVGAQWLACVTLRTDAQDSPVTRPAPPLKAEVVG
jgi:hypothetical protein